MRTLTDRFSSSRAASVLAALVLAACGPSASAPEPSPATGAAPTPPADPGTPAAAPGVADERTAAVDPSPADAVDPADAPAPAPVIPPVPLVAAGPASTEALPALTYRPASARPPEQPIALGEGEVDLLRAVPARVGIIGDLATPRALFDGIAGPGLVVEGADVLRVVAVLPPDADARALVVHGVTGVPLGVTRAIVVRDGARTEHAIPESARPARIPLGGGGGVIDVALSVSTRPGAREPAAAISEIAIVGVAGATVARAPRVPALALAGGRVVEPALPAGRYALDASPAPSRGPGSLAAIELAMARRYGVNVAALGRVRLAARGAPPVSLALVLVDAVPDHPVALHQGDQPLDPRRLAELEAALARAADEGSTEPGDASGAALLATVSSRAPVSGPRGQEWIDGVDRWTPASAADEWLTCPSLDEGPTLYLVRVVHDVATAAPTELTEIALGRVCRIAEHDLRVRDEDGDGQLELRLQVGTSNLESDNPFESARDTWIVDVATMWTELAHPRWRESVSRDGDDATEVATHRAALEDVDGDGRQDVTLTGHTVSSWREEDGRLARERRDHEPSVLLYDVATDTFLPAAVPAG